MVTKDQVKELEALARPLAKWLNDNSNPHAKIIIECGIIELLDGVCGIPCEDLISD